jgi:hypothetical protein
MGFDKIGHCARLKMHTNITSSLVISSEEGRKGDAIGGATSLSSQMKHSNSKAKALAVCKDQTAGGGAVGSLMTWAVSTCAPACHVRD